MFPHQTHCKKIFGAAFIDPPVVNCSKLHEQPTVSLLWLMQKQASKHYKGACARLQMIL